MKKATLFPICICLLTLALTRAEERQQSSLRSPENAAEPKVPTTPEQRQEIVATTRSLEKAPFRVGATIEREKALWLIDHAPDIFPKLGRQFTGDITDSGIPDSRPIYAQFIFGFVSFQIEQPAKADDPVAVYQAALKSCLQVYRKALERDINNRLTVLDIVSEHERNGTLSKYVEQYVATELQLHRSK